MKPNPPTNVTAAFELLLEEIEEEIELVNQAGAKAFGEGQYERVDAARQQAGALTAYRRKLVELRREWQTLSTGFDVTEGENEDEEQKASRRDLGRLQRGVRTPEEAFRRPILQVLADMGGSSKVRDVLTQVEKLIRSELSEADYQHLPSMPNTPRWYNTAQWSRNSMVQEGLLRDDSPRGTWEISEAGRRYLESS
jgi:restriction system protein